MNMHGMQLVVGLILGDHHSNFVRDILQCGGKIELHTSLVIIIYIAIKLYLLNFAADPEQKQH